MKRVQRCPHINAVFAKNCHNPWLLTRQDSTFLVKEKERVDKGLIYK
jgi:hypothetical protein